MILWCAISALAQTTNQEVPQQAAPTEVGYPDSPEGLRQLIHDVLTATQAHDEQRISSLLRSFIIPNHAVWFGRVFGPAEGANLAASYGSRLPKEAEYMRKFFSEIVQTKGDLVIEPVKDSAEPGEGVIAGPLRQSIKEPVVFYSAGWRISPSASGRSLGYFVFIDRGFRRIDVEVLFALSALKPTGGVPASAGAPKRLRVGGMVMMSKLINKVPPRYPAEARERRIQGTVRIQALVDKDGIVRDTQVISGYPLLAEAAVQAVRQWRYQPTLLNGESVEVETTIDVVFTLRR